MPASLGSQCLHQEMGADCHHAVIESTRPSCEQPDSCSRCVQQRAHPELLPHTSCDLELDRVVVYGEPMQFNADGDRSVAPSPLTMEKSEEGVSADAGARCAPPSLPSSPPPGLPSAEPGAGAAAAASMIARGGDPFPFAPSAPMEAAEGGPPASETWSLSWKMWTVPLPDEQASQSQAR